MKLLKNLLLIAALYKLQCKAAQSVASNLAFFGRGQRGPTNYWNDINMIKGSNNAKVFYPYSESDSSDIYKENSENVKRKNTEENSFNNADSNYPLVLFLPGKRNAKYSKIAFNIVNNENIDIDLSHFHKIKSEMKLVAPTADDLISEGYTCESIGLDCIDLKDLDFKARKDEWLSKVDIKLYLESDEINNTEDNDLSPEELLLKTS